MEELIKLDHQLFLYLNGLGSETYDGFWMFITNKWGAIPLYIILLVLCFWKLGWKKTLLVLGMVGLLIAGADQLANVFKYGFKRLRPCYTLNITDQMRLVKDWCGGQYSYFSAHSSNSFAVALFFGMLFKPYFKWLLPVLIVWSLAVGYSRIYIGVHFPGDVLTGFFFGAIIALLVFKLYKVLVVKFRLE
ncbi:phosphatase PAP2 family protein [Neptunitalea chrysea]|uniref:Phosphatase PAP2 family protein n=1 Tax=Neptunitalea chrysea TaxID=1647581 RepID=A0A9W6B5W0_9FLAO|nr:phosphatase PAP2 family protein [Neptunitalea chrysea]GLB53214.1 phosphatase PAP2 family protein [Neptunitalea chrysea]